MKMKVTRPGYRKFRLADLGIDIVEKNPREFTIMEPARNAGHDNKQQIERNGSAIHRNHAYGANSRDPRQPKELVKILIFNQIISGDPFLCFSDSKTEYCLPSSFQMTNSILSRVIRHTSRIDMVMDKISNCEFVPVDIYTSDLPGIIEAAQKYGRTINKERRFGNKSTKTSNMEDVISDSEGIGFRYLLACTI